MNRYLSLLLAVLPLLVVRERPIQPPSGPAAEQQPDTAWVDEKHPYLASEVPQQLEEIWMRDRDAGTCFIGSIRELDGRRAAHIERATAAAFPDRCTGFTRYVGASIFLRDAQDDASEEELEERAQKAACELLRDHPQWAVAAAVYGFGRQLTTREGQVVEQTARLKAWFCTWQKSSADRQEAVPGDSARSR